MEACWVIGDRETDAQLALNLGCRALILKEKDEDSFTDERIRYVNSWDRIAEILFAGERKARVRRTTKETDIEVRLDLDGSGRCDIRTGLGFFDHMLEQIGKHGGMDLYIRTEGDLQVDEHHTIEDTALALGECLLRALGDKRGIRRFGFLLPMDEALARCALDISGRPYLTFKAKFKHRHVGDLSTEMIEHFFRSLSQTMGITLNLKAKGGNDHHVAESLFKAFGRTLRDAVRVEGTELPSSKGVL